VAYKNDIEEIKGYLEIPFKYSYGQYFPVFYNGLKEKKIMAVSCPQCKGVILPPRPYCGRCFVDVEEEWVELEDEGTVKSYTVVHIPFTGQPTDPPYCYALIRLDASTTASTRSTTWRRCTSACGSRRSGRSTGWAASTTSSTSSPSRPEA